MKDLIPIEIWDELMAVAKQDNIITKDEEILLDNIKKNLNKYYKSIKDNPTDEKEKLKVLGNQLEILREAYDTAYEDGKITKDELELLKKIQKIVRKITEEQDI